MTFSDCVVIIPCHNEGIAIAETVQQIREFLPDAHVVVVDNKSTDNTAEAAKSSGAIVVNAPAIGKANAIRKGFEYIDMHNYSVIIMIDGDATYSAEKLPEAYKLIKESNYDMVVGKRVAIKSNSKDKQLAFRKFHILGNSFLTAINYRLFGIEIADTLSGWRAFSNGFVGSFYSESSGFEIESELNAHAYVLRCSIANIEVAYSGRHINSQSKLKTFSDGFKILKNQLRMFKNEKPTLAYSLISAPFLIGGIELIHRVYETYTLTRMVPNFPSLISGVASITIALIFWSTGLVLEHLRLVRSQNSYYRFSELKRLIK